MLIKRNGTPSKCIGYGLYLYFPGLPFRNAAKALSFLHMAKRSHVATWKRIQKYHPKRIPSDIIKEGVSGFMVGGAAIRAGSECIWFGVAIEQQNRQILALSISRERNMFAAGRFTAGLAEAHKKTSGFHRWGWGGWYPQTCRFLKPNHHIHSHFGKSLTERAMQYIKDRTGCFDDYIPCRKAGCNIHHVKNWLNLFARMHNKKVMNA
jgi:putative transposase